jgi:hypothetical protein
VIPNRCRSELQLTQFLNLLSEGNVTGRVTCLFLVRGVKFHLFGDERLTHGREGLIGRSAIGTSSRVLTVSALCSPSHNSRSRVVPVRGMDGSVESCTKREYVCRMKCMLEIVNPCTLDNEN